MPQPVPIKRKSSLTLCPTESSSLWGMELYHLCIEKLLIIQNRLNGK